MIRNVSVFLLCVCVTTRTSFGCLFRVYLEQLNCSVSLFFSCFVFVIIEEIVRLTYLLNVVSTDM